MEKQEENWTEPTGTEEVKKGSKTFTRYIYEKGKGRFVNTSRFCTHCRQRSECYQGKHSYVMACPEREFK